MTAEANGETINITVTKIFTSSSVIGQGLVVTKDVTPTTAPVNATTTFTYTIKIKNEGTGTSEIEEIKDFLPPGFTHTGPTSGITTNDPIVSPGAVTRASHYLNDDAALPYSLDMNRGGDQLVATSTPAENVWTEVPEYWETAPYSAGTFPATNWEQRQWIKAAHASNKWRWKVQRNRGGTITDLFTSSASNVTTSWNQAAVAHSPGDISMQSGDKLRLRLEVFSPNPTPPNRVVTYRWGGDDPGFPDYDSKLEIPRLRFCGDGSQYELKWAISPRVQIASQQELILTFQASATVADGTSYNQAQVKYRPSWSLATPITTSSSNTAEVTVGTGTPECSHVGEIVMSKTVDNKQVDVGVPTTLTYTVSFKNTASATMWLCEFDDWLPPDHVYQSGSPAGDISWEPFAVIWEADAQRYRANWLPNGGDFIMSIGAGLTKSFTFQVEATLEQGVDYFNEIDGLISDVSTCDGESTAWGGASGSGSTSAFPLYDVVATAADGTVKARVQVSGSNIDILSWQQ